MLHPSRIPPLDLWPELEAELRRERHCTADTLPSHLFCGKPAVCLVDHEPRCEELVEPS